MLLVDIGEAVAVAAVVGVQLDIRDKHIVGDGRLADHVAVLKASARSSVRAGTPFATVRVTSSS